MKSKIVYLHTIGFTSKNLLKIQESEQDFEDFYDNFGIKELKKLGIKEEKIEKILENKRKLDTLKLDQLLKNLKVEIITLNDSKYPQNLKNLYTPPFVLYIRGKLKNTNFFSIVGTRKPTTYSEKIIKNFIPALVENGFGIVSGGAYGVDSLVHKTTLENNGYTLSVIGTGIDKNYPDSNKKLYDEIIEKDGCILSIFPIGTPPNMYNFPIRNDIIAGLSDGILVTEAGEKSGTLITAKLALDLGKDVFVVPGDIFKKESAGINLLIKNTMAKPVFGAEDILEEYNINLENTKIQEIKEIEFEDQIEQKIYELLQKESLNSTEICQKLEMEVGEITYRLSILEIGGFIKLRNDGEYSIQ
ncbi:MAG: DNA-processing protein DprA [Candidatus Gracilibacteria bacterium]|nr:DNA-processing protein DprA [Candidatus Gracilibacteria bacterium]